MQVIIIIIIYVYMYICMYIYIYIYNTVRLSKSHQFTMLHPSHKIKPESLPIFPSTLYQIRHVDPVSSFRCHHSDGPP